MRTPEGVQKDLIDRRLKDVGAYVLKPVTYGYGASGAPDRVCCISGQFWGFEIKREGKEPTAIQNRRMREIIDNGGLVAWGTAADILPVLDRWLRRHAFGGFVNAEEPDIHAGPLPPPRKAADVDASDAQQGGDDP